MNERLLTFAEVQNTLGISADEVRDLMEQKTLRGVVHEGVVKFGEAAVMRLKHGDATAAPANAAFTFLVDEDEEEAIEGQAYDGEQLVVPEVDEQLGPDEEIMEPVDLSEEQRRNVEVLGTNDVAAFGRDVAERARSKEFGSAELAEDEEIFEPSEVELPEATFTGLASAVPEATREEPPRPETPAEPETVEAAPVEETPETVEEIAAEVTESERVVAEPVEEVIAEEPAPVEETALVLDDVTPVEIVDETPAEEVTFVEEEREAIEVEAETVGVEEPEEIRFELEEAETVEAGAETGEFTFLEEDTGPMACPVEEQTPAAEEVPVVAEEPAPEVETVAEEPEPEPIVLEPEVETVPPEGELSFTEEVAETLEPEEVAEQPLAEQPVAEESAVEGVAETFEPVEPEPTPMVTEEAAFAVDEETVEVEPEPEPELVDIEELTEEPALAEEPSAAVTEPIEEIAEAPPEPVVAEVEPVEPEPVAEEVEPVVEPELELVALEPEPEPVAEVPEKVPEPSLGEVAAATGGAAAFGAMDLIDELEAELDAEEQTVAEGAADEEITPSIAKVASTEDASFGNLPEEARQVTEEWKDEETQRPEDDMPDMVPTPLSEPSEDEGIEVFDLDDEGTPAATPEPVQEAEDMDDLVMIEDEGAKAPTSPVGAAAKDKTLEEEMAELFGEEVEETHVDEAFARPAVKEDFDLSMFQADTAVEEEVPVSTEGLFEMGAEAQQAAMTEAPLIEEQHIEIGGVSRIRALQEERAAPGAMWFTVSILLTFVALASVVMFLWILHYRG